MSRNGINVFHLIQIQQCIIWCTQKCLGVLPLLINVQYSSPTSLICPSLLLYQNSLTIIYILVKLQFEFIYPINLWKSCFRSSIFDSNQTFGSNLVKTGVFVVAFQGYFLTASELICIGIQLKNRYSSSSLLQYRVSFKNSEC